MEVSGDMRMAGDSISSRVVDRVVQIGTLIEKCTGFICVLLFLWMLLVALMGVFFRYVMHNPFQWTEEVCRYTLIWLGFIAINMAIWRDEHIKFNFLVNRLSGMLAKIVFITGYLLIAVYLFVILIKGYSMTMNTMMTAQSMSISMKWFYMAVPISALLSITQVFLLLIKTVLLPADSRFTSGRN